jgi:hypothetical protein
MKKLVIICDNCKQEETNHEHVRVVRVEMHNPPSAESITKIITDPGLVDIGIEKPTFDLCGFCASRMRQGLKDAQEWLVDDTEDKQTAVFTNPDPIVWEPGDGPTKTVRLLDKLTGKTVECQMTRLSNGHTWVSLVDEGESND